MFIFELLNVVAVTPVGTEGGFGRVLTVDTVYQLVSLPSAFLAFTFTIYEVSEDKPVIVPTAVMLHVFCLTKVLFTSNAASAYSVPLGFPLLLNDTDILLFSIPSILPFAGIFASVYIYCL